MAHDPDLTYGYEPLSIQDQLFLALERRGTPMHVTATCVFEGGPLIRPDGRLDLYRLRSHFASSLTSFPRYRQRLARVPLNGAPVWVDDDRFDLDYHLRYARLGERAGSEESGLKEICGRIMSRELDRTRPLWEAWIVDGFEAERFALITKVHHALADGVAGVDLLASLLQPEDGGERAWPRAVPAPRPLQLLYAEMRRRSAAPWSTAQSWLPTLIDPASSLRRLADGSRALWDTLGAGLRRAPASPLNRPIGPRRRFDWLSMDLRQVKEIKNRLGGTINDVVLATVAGAVRRFLERRGADVDDLRALVPVNLRTPSQRCEKGNHVTAWLVDLPMRERDPLRCFSTIRARTEPLRASTRALEGEVLTAAGMWALQFAGSVLGALRPFNLVVTNVPGPSALLDLLGSRLDHAYPQVPLFAGQGLGIALFSYADKLCWGFNADYELLPDLESFPSDITAAFEELRLCAELLHHARTQENEASSATVVDIREVRTAGVSPRVDASRDGSSPLVVAL